MLPLALQSCSQVDSVCMCAHLDVVLQQIVFSEFCTAVMLGKPCVGSARAQMSSQTRAHQALKL